MNVHSSWSMAYAWFPSQTELLFQARSLKKCTVFFADLIKTGNLYTYLKYFSCIQTGWDQKENQTWNHNLSCLETFITNTSWLNKLSLAMEQKHQHCDLGHNILSKHHRLTLLTWVVKINNREHYYYAFNTQWKPENFSLAILLKTAFFNNINSESQFAN